MDGLPANRHHEGRNGLDPDSFPLNRRHPHRLAKRMRDSFSVIGLEDITDRIRVERLQRVIGIGRDENNTDLAEDP